MSDTGETAGVGRTRVVRCAWWLGALSMAACFLSLAPAKAASPEEGPTLAVKSTVKALHSILEEFTDPRQSEGRRSAIEQVIRHRVHYQEMAKRSLGASWNHLDDAARQEYVGLFVQLLRDALANKMVDYSGERMSYLAEHRKSGCAEVNTRLFGEKVDTVIDFRLTNVAGSWLIYDAVVDGVSLVESYRAQFASILRDASVAQLIQRMSNRTFTVKLFESGS